VCVNGSQTNGETGILAYIPLPCVLEVGNLAFYNPTAQVTFRLMVNRFIPGAGFTSWSLGSTFSPSAFGTSGVALGGVSLPASGSTLLQLMPNDNIGYEVGGGSTAAIYGVAGSFVVRPVQDVRVFLGLI
jgi:hypothetical protein